LLSDSGDAKWRDRDSLLSGRGTLNPEEKEAIGRIVLKIIEDDFHGDLAEAWSFAVALTETIPEQANNEVRNCMTHLGRAIAAPDRGSADREISQASNHLERAKRDCLKIAIIAMDETLGSNVMLIEDSYGLLPRNVRDRIKRIKRERREIYRDESKGNEAVGARLEKLLFDYSELEEFLLDNYASAVSPKLLGKFRRWAGAWNRKVGPLGTAVAGAILGGVVLLAAFPDASVVRTEAIREFRVAQDVMTRGLQIGGHFIPGATAEHADHPTTAAGVVK
jgi:hypothetical protein